MSLILTRTQNLRETSNLDKNELRPSRYGAMDIFVQQAEDPAGLLTPQLKALAEKSIGSILETPVYDFNDGITIGNTRELVIADEENTSRMYQFNFSTLSFSFTMVPAAFMNNEISMQQDFNRKMTERIYKLADVLDTMALAALAATKTSVLRDPLYYEWAANTIKATWAQRENIIGSLDPMLASNDHFGNIHIVGNGGIEDLINKLKQHGGYNDVNKQLEYLNKMLHFTPRLTNASGIGATGYAVMGGSLGVLYRFEREAILRTKTNNGYEWDITTLPMLNIPCGTYYYESVGDFNALNGAATADLDRARKQHFGFAVDVCFVTPYNSDPTTIANPILKLAIGKENAS